MAQARREAMIQIGPLSYTIETVTDLKTADGVGLFGEIEYQQQIIRLESEMTPVRRFTALWHEVIHGASDLYQLNLSEQTTGTLAMIIVQLLHDNPILRSES